MFTMDSPRSETVRPPFDCAPHVLHPDGVVAMWLTEPAGIVIQIAQPTHAKAELARWLVDAAVPAMKGLLANKYFLVLDWTLMLSRDADARKIFVDSASSLKPAPVSVHIIPPQNASPLFVSSMRVASALIAAFGVDLQIDASLPLAVSTCGLRAAKANAP
jgi:hypothetical protein